MTPEGVSQSAMDHPTSRRPWTKGQLVVLALWIVVAIGVLVRVSLHPNRSTVLPAYLAAGERWLEGTPLYPTLRGFIYSPLIAALIVPFTFLPVTVAGVVWRLLNMAAYLGTTAAWLRAGEIPLPKSRWHWVFLAMLPLSIGNFNNGQLNPAMIAAIMGAILAVRRDRWMAAALLIALVTYLKVYPLAAGLLLVLLFPRKFTWWLVLMLVALGSLSFILQKPGYVLEQYHSWIATRAADRRHGDPGDAPRDFWMILHACGLDLDMKTYFVTQILGGATLAGFLVWGQRSGWSRDRILTALLALVVSWMLLLGPAPEAATYIILVPVLSFALVKVLSEPFPVWMRSLAIASFSLLLGTQMINSFGGAPRDPFHMSIAPAGALLFAVFAIAWASRSEHWKAQCSRDAMGSL